MASQDGRYWIVFNGEVYNYVELAEELSDRFGSVFKTRTDTEVVLDAFRRWGPECLGRFDGMFAFAIWDVELRRLFCARDPVGIKPFYFSNSDCGFVFASEPRAVLTGLGTKGHTDSARLAEFLALGVSDTDDGTFFREVRQLPGGCWMWVQDGGPISGPNRFWHPPEQLLGDNADVARALVDRLRVSVSRQLRSDVPVGSCLSGGLDSGAITVTVGEIMGGDTSACTALTLRNPGFKDDESELARTTAAAAGMAWTPVDVSLVTLGEDVEAMAAAMGEPFNTLSMFAQYQIMKAASELGLKVMLDGQGGDEVYVGY